MLKHLRHLLATALFILLIATASSCDQWLEPSQPEPTTKNTKIPVEFRELPR